MELTIERDFETDRLSLYRTRHVLAAYGELRDVGQLANLAERRAAHPAGCFVVGNGSNLFFSRPRIESLVVKNGLPRLIERRERDEIWISGTVSVMEVLRFCLRESLDSFYYLASVPATIGGAVAMNAGRGRGSGRSIFDFLKRVRYYDMDTMEIVEATAEEVLRGYRETIFTGGTGRIVLEAAFVFPRADFSENPIEARKVFAAGQQDYSGPNCGSVFKVYDPSLLRMTKRLGPRWRGARFSKKTLNWIVNDSPHSSGIAGLVRAVELVHRILRRPIVREIVTVD